MKNREHLAKWKRYFTIDIYNFIGKNVENIENL